MFIFNGKVKQNCQHFWKEQKQASFKSFSRMSSITSALVVLQSLVARTLWQKSYIFWSVTVYKKNPEIQFYSSNRTSARQNNLLFSVKEKIFLEIILIEFFFVNKKKYSKYLQEDCKTVKYYEKNTIENFWKDSKLTLYHFLSSFW